MESGEDGARTHDLLTASQVLSQLSYFPVEDARFRLFVYPRQACFYFDFLGWVGFLVVFFLGSGGVAGISAIHLETCAATIGF